MTPSGVIGVSTLKTASNVIIAASTIIPSANRMPIADTINLITGCRPPDRPDALRLKYLLLFNLLLMQSLYHIKLTKSFDIRRICQIKMNILQVKVSYAR